jgi:hypothetical protein
LDEKNFAVEISTQKSFSSTNATAGKKIALWAQRGGE